MIDENSNEITEKSVRETMKLYRLAHGIGEQEMADACLISRKLLFMIESGDVTSPGIASRIAKQYQLSELEYEMLIPKNRRPHGGDYEPDRWVHDLPFRIPAKELKIDI